MNSLLVVFCLVAAAAAIDWKKVEPISLQPGFLKHLPEFKRGSQARIAGGEEAKPQQFPYQVGILAHMDNGKTGFCGGSLLTTSYVLTAAHCADAAKTFTVVLGAHNVTDENEKGQIRIKSEISIVHSKWFPLLVRNDIALIKLPQAVELNERIQTIRLPKKSQMSEDFVDAKATASGWGKAGDSATGISEILRFASNVVISNDECNKSFFGVIQPTNICFSGKGGKSTCQGDSGGPLTVVDKDNKITQVGLTSFGLSLGCEIGFPAAFTRVTGYLDWLEKNSDFKASA